jgi:Tfp pilus assembly protein PilO
MLNESAKIKNQTQLFPLLISIICLTIGYFIIFPKIDELKLINTQIEAKNQNISEIQEKITNLNALKNEFTNNSGTLESVNLALADSSQLAEIIEQVTGISQKSGMNLKSIKPDSKQLNNELLINLSLQGDYSSLINFTENVEKNLRPISVKSISMSMSTDGIFDANIGLGVLTLEDNKSVQVNTAINANNITNGGVNE